jgi:DUF4097 and DUF4098 domain-containing protein YvlB
VNGGGQHSMRTLLTLVVIATAATAATASPLEAQDRDGRLSPGARASLARAQRDRSSSQRQDGREQVERVNRTFRLGQNGELHLGNISGDITITRGAGNEASVEIVKTARGRDDAEAREQLQLVQVDVTERNNRAEVKTRYPEGEENRRNNRRNFNVSVAYNVTAPAGLRIRATSISGSITTRDIKGELWAESVSGTVRIFNGGRVGTAKSISGNVEINDTDIDGLLNASTVSGSVLLRRVKARQIEVGSISGDVVLEGVDSSQVEGQTVSGSVRFGGPVVRGARYEFSSHSGDVSVALGGNDGFEVQATSFSGSIRSDFSFSADNGDGRRSRRRQSIRGVVGDGSAVVELTTFSGSIVIAKR